MGGSRFRFFSSHAAAGTAAASTCLAFGNECDDRFAAATNRRRTPVSTSSHANGSLKTWLVEIQRVLKPNGVFGVEEHRAKADANPDESAKKGYLPEKWVIEHIEAKGFKLAGKSEINANPKDTKDYPEGVWTLPPALQLGDKDKDKYVAIGESDRMTLKFTKVAKPAAAAAPATPATRARGAC